MTAASEHPVAEHPIESSDKAKPDKLRSLKVGQYPEARTKIPWIRLKGYWLAAAGFEIGTRVQVQVSAGRLVIISDKDYPAKMSSRQHDRRR